MAGHAAAALGVEVAGGVVLPADAAVGGIEGVDVGAVEVVHAGGEVGDAVVHQHAAGDRPRRDERAVDRDSPLDRRCAESPEELAGGRLEGVDPAVAGADQGPAVGDRGRIADGAAGVGGPSHFAVRGVPSARTIPSEPATNTRPPAATGAVGSTPLWAALFQRTPTCSGTAVEVRAVRTALPRYVGQSAG